MSESQSDVKYLSRSERSGSADADEDCIDDKAKELTLDCWLVCLLAGLLDYMLN